MSLNYDRIIKHVCDINNDIVEPKAGWTFNYNEDINKKTIDIYFRKNPVVSVINQIDTDINVKVWDNELYSRLAEDCYFLFSKNREYIDTNKLTDEISCLFKKDIDELNQLNFISLYKELEISEGETDAIHQGDENLEIKSVLLEYVYFRIAYIRHLAGIEHHNTIHDFYAWLGELEELYNYYGQALKELSL